MVTRDPRARPVRRASAAHPRQPERRPEARLRDHGRRGGRHRPADGSGDPLRRARPSRGARPDRGARAGGPTPAVPAHGDRAPPCSPSSSASSPSSPSSASPARPVPRLTGDASHDRPAAPPLPGALASPLRRRVRRGPRRATTRPVRRGRHPARRARCPSPSPRPRSHVPARKGICHVAPHRGVRRHRRRRPVARSCSRAMPSTTAASRVSPFLGYAVVGATVDDARRARRPQRLPGPAPPGAHLDRLRDPRPRGHDRTARVRIDRPDGRQRCRPDRRQSAPG